MKIHFFCQKKGSFLGYVKNSDYIRTVKITNSET